MAGGETKLRYYSPENQIDRESVASRQSYWGSGHLLYQLKNMQAQRRR